MTNGELHQVVRCFDHQLPPLLTDPPEQASMQLSILFQAPSMSYMGTPLVFTTGCVQQKQPYKQN